MQAPTFLVTFAATSEIMLRASDHSITSHNRVDALEAAKIEQQPPTFASTFIRHDTSADVSEKLARLGCMSEAPLLSQRRQHDRFGFGKSDEHESRLFNSAGHKIPLGTKAKESMAAPKRYASNVRAHFGLDDSRSRDKPDLSSSGLPRLTRKPHPSVRTDSILHRRTAKEGPLGTSWVDIADTMATQWQRPSRTTQELHPKSNGVRIAQRALNSTRRAQNDGQQMRRGEQQQFFQFQKQQKGLSSLDHISNTPAFIQCSESCEVCRNVKSAMNQLTAARKRRETCLLADTPEAELQVEKLGGVLDDLEQHSKEYHERQRSPINLSSLLATLPSKCDGSNIFEKHDKQGFFLHHTISVDRTGTNHEVATSILSVLGQKERPSIFGKCGQGGDVNGQNGLDSAITMPPAVLSSFNQGSTDYTPRSTLRSQRKENWETQTSHFADNSIAYLRQNGLVQAGPNLTPKPGCTEERLPTKPESGHVLRPGDFFWRKDTNEHPPHVTESIPKKVHHHESGTLLDLPPIYWQLSPNDNVPSPSRDCVLCKKRLAVTSFAWFGPGRGLLCSTCSKEFSHDDMPTEELWKNYRRKITSLFVDERRSCREIAVLMARQFNFSASEGAYLLLLKEWGVLQRPYSHPSFGIAKSVFQLEQDASEDQDRSKHEHVKAGGWETTTEAATLKNVHLPSQKTNIEGRTVDEKGHRNEQSPTKEDWEGYKSLIVHQYIHKDNNMRELRTFMEHVCRFKATDRMYKQRFATWQISKDRKSSNNSIRRKMKEKCTFCQRDCVERARAAALKQQNQQRMIHDELADTEEEQWDMYKNRIIGLYSNGHRDLEYINHYMKATFAFVGSRQGYEEHLREWGVLREDHHDDASSVWEGSDSEDDGDHVLEI